MCWSYSYLFPLQLDEECCRIFRIKLDWNHIWPYNVLEHSVRQSYRWNPDVPHSIIAQFRIQWSSTYIQNYKKLDNIFSVAKYTNYVQLIRKKPSNVIKLASCLGGSHLTTAEQGQGSCLNSHHHVVQNQRRITARLNTPHSLNHWWDNTLLQSLF